MPDPVVEALKPIQGPPPPPPPETQPPAQAPEPEEEKGKISKFLHRKQAPAEQTQETGAAQFPREKILTEATSGRTQEGRFGKRKESKEKAGPIALTEKLRGEIVSYLKGHLQGLIEVKERHPNNWQDAMLEADRNLLQAFSDEHGNILSDDQIDAALRRPEGDILGLVTVAMERGTAMQILEIGLIDAANARAVRQKYTRPGTVIAPEERKRIYRRGGAVLHRTFTGEHSALARIAANVGGAFGGAALTDLIRQIPAEQLSDLAVSLASNPHVYGAAGGIILTNILLGRLPAANADIILNASMETVRHWQATMNPAQRYYMQRVFGFDIDGIDTTGGRIVLTPGSRTMNLDDLERQISSNLGTLHDLYTEIGRHQYKTGRRTPHQLLGPRLQNEEQITTRWRTAIEHIADQMPAANDLQRILNYLQAQEQFLTGGLEEYITEVLGKPLSEVRREAQRGSIQQLKDAALDRRNNAGKWSERHRSRQEALEKDKKFLEGEEVDVGEGRRERKEGELTDFDRWEGLQRELTTLNRSIIRDHSEEIDITGVTTVDALLTRHSEVIYGPTTTPGTIDYELAQIENGRDRELAPYRGVTDFQRTVRGRTGESETETMKVSDIVKDINIRFDDQRKSVAEKRTRLLTQRKALLAQQSEVLSVQQKIAELDNKFIRLHMAILQRDYDAMIALGLTNDDLATMDIADLEISVNAAGGWPEAENLQATHREQLLHAIVEARTRQSIAIDVSLGAGAIGAFDVCRSLGLNEEFLRAQTVDEISLRANEINSANPALGWPVAQNAANRPIVEAAKLAANRYLELRITAYRSLAHDLDLQARRQGEMADPKTMERRVSQFDDAAAVMSAQGDIYTRTRKTFESTVLRAEALSAAAVGAAGGDYTAPERTLGATQGYYEFLDLVFNYRNQPNRSSYFERISDLLSPQELAQILIDSPRVLTPPGVAPDLNLILPEIEVSLGIGTTTPDDMRAVMSDVIDFVRAKAVSYL